MPNPRPLLKYTARSSAGAYLAAVNPATPGPAATPPHLPAPLPQPTALLRRAQGTLAVLRDENKK